MGERMDEKTYIVDFKDATEYVSTKETVVKQTRCYIPVGNHKALVNIAMLAGDIEKFEIKIQVTRKNNEWWVL
jgi:hypothetical protein